MKIIVEILNPILSKDLTAAGQSDIPFFIAKGFGCSEKDIKVYLQDIKKSKEEVAKELFDIVASEYKS